MPSSAGGRATIDSNSNFRFDVQIVALESHRNSANCVWSRKINQLAVFLQTAESATRGLGAQRDDGLLRDAALKLADRA
jgi:hypothetical protein